MSEIISLNEADTNSVGNRKVALALSAARFKLRNHDFDWLLDGRIVVGMVPDHHLAMYIPKSDTIVINADGDLQQLSLAIIHEAGHRLHFKSLSFTKQAKIALKYAFTATDNHLNRYSGLSHHEMFAELFRLFILDELSAKELAWMDNILEKVKVLYV